MFAAHSPNPDTDNRILEVNKNQHLYTWKANPCMLSKDHAEFKLAQCEAEDDDDNEDDLDASPVQSLMQNNTSKAAVNANVTLGKFVKANSTKGVIPVRKIKKPKKKRRTNFLKHPSSGKGKFGDMSNPRFVEAIKRAQSWSKKFNSPEEIPDAEIPVEYDFRNIKGFDFTGKLRD